MEVRTSKPLTLQKQVNYILRIPLGHPTPLDEIFLAPIKLPIVIILPCVVNQASKSTLRDFLTGSKQAVGTAAAKLLSQHVFIGMTLRRLDAIS